MVVPLEAIPRIGWVGFCWKDASAGLACSFSRKIRPDVVPANTEELLWASRQVTVSPAGTWPKMFHSTCWLTRAPAGSSTVAMTAAYTTLLFAGEARAMTGERFVPDVSPIDGITGRRKTGIIPVASSVVAF